MLLRFVGIAPEDREGSMKLVAVEQLRPGDALGKTVFDEAGRVLIPAGFALADDQIEKVRELGAGRVAVMEVERRHLPETIIRGIGGAHPLRWQESVRARR
ncbi:MAG: hypothetical protein MAG453_01085 [Calditrichaeota bacterium]|nr:hypothetical protein [Calditrichota bacterium]